MNVVINNESTGITHATNVVLCIYYTELIKLLCLVLSCLWCIKYDETQIYIHGNVFK